MNEKLCKFLLQKVAINRETEVLKVLLKYPVGLPLESIEELLKDSENFKAADWSDRPFTFYAEVKATVAKLQVLGLTEEVEDKSVPVVFPAEGDTVFLKRLRVPDNHFNKLKELLL